METDINIELKDATLEGNMAIPEKASGVVLFAHGSGSSRFSPRNIFVAKVLQKNGIATILTDLLTEEEDRDYQTRFDIDLLTERLVAVTRWIQKKDETRKLSIGLFGASTGAAAALRDAAILGTDIKAVVSRGGRPDLALDFLSNVKSPTLLIVGGNDFEVIDLNEIAYERLPGIKKMEIVEGATHLFEEKGTLEKVADLASAWFEKYL